MSRIWAVALQTVAEGVRMRIFLVVLVLVGLVVLGLPLSVQGDGSLTGAVQSFLSYSLIASSLLLGILTIFMSRSLADELTNRHVFLVMTKPIPRWQFIVGKWLGITLLNAVFLTCIAMFVFGMVQYIRWTRPPIDTRFDKQVLENEILVARHAIKQKPPSFLREAEAEFDRNKEQGLYDGVPTFDTDVEKHRLMKKNEAAWRVVGPQDARLFEFENVLVDRSRSEVIQLRYKTEVAGFPPDEIFRAQFLFGNRFKGTPERIVNVRHVVGRYHTVAVPADVVAADHTLTVRFYNRNPFEGEPQFRNVIEFRRSDELEVLFVVGSFAGNFVRLLILVFCKLMFLAATAILMTSIFSFPVACLVSFTVYAAAGTKAFLSEAFELATADYLPLFSSTKTFFWRTLGWIYEKLFLIIPDFSRHDAVEDFVNGRNVSLVWVLQTVTELGLIKTSIVLGLAILLFYRREVAELSL